jgi:ADP-ribosyl-[dinitrogen reductase] hydrolase
MSERTDRQAGVLFGLAAGDRIGGPLSMALTLAECLADRGGFDPEAIGRRYFEWWKSDGFDSGPTSAMVFSKVAAGSSIETASHEVHVLTKGMTAGCNPAHRAAPLAMALNILDEDLADAAMAEARLTHLHPLAGDVSAAVVRLCRSLIRGTEWPEALHFASIGRLPETRRALDRKVPFDGVPGGFAPEVLAGAVRYVDRADSFSKALGQALAEDPGSNYVPVLVGSIGGARWGRSVISEESISMHRSEIGRIESAVERLLALAPRS